MKKHLVMLVAVFVALAVAMPALAAVEFKYGGQFRVRYWGEDNVRDGSSADWWGSAANRYNGNDNRNLLDQRLRLYFSFVASKNLKLVTKFEIGDGIWGADAANGTNTGPNLGANAGGDAVAVEVKNIYFEFNIPNTPSTALVGLQSAVLLDSWIIDDDLPAAIVVTNLDPFKVTVGYVAGQNGAERALGSSFLGINSASNLVATTSGYRVDDFFAAINYAQGPWKGSLVGFFQDGHSSGISADPSTLNTPNRGFTGTSTSFSKGLGYRDNFLFDLGLNVTYKVDWLLAYVNFVKNLGSTDLVSTNGSTVSADYTGFMVDAGVTYFCGPYTFNLGGFYTSGPDISDSPTQNDANGRFRGLESKDINWFTYPFATSKYFSEIIGGGVLGDDIYVYRGLKAGSAASAFGGNGTAGDTMYWRGYQFPTNLWTITAGGSWQVAEKTKLSASYWYFGTASSVPVAASAIADNGAVTGYKMSSSIGHELDFYVDQGIVDGLTLTLVGAYLIADDAFAPMPYGVAATPGTTSVNNVNLMNSHADDAWKLGARLQWNF